jgi:ABC-type uncharacterized transport system permease subunit
LTETRPRDFACFLVGLCVFAVAAGVGFFVWAILGALTGVLGPCMTAPDWWAFTYTLLGLVVFAASVFVGKYVYDRV